MPCAKSTLLVLLCAASTLAQMSMGAEEEEMMEAMGIKGQPMGRKNLNPQAELLKQDFKYIRCGVCRKMVDVAMPKATELLEKRFAYKKKRRNEATEFDGEGAVQEFVEKMCNPLKPEGEWVSMIDLAQEGEQLQLATQPTAGKCLKECRTVEAVCEQVLDKADTQFTEILYEAVKEGSTLEQTQRYICNRAAGVCKKKAPPPEGDARVRREVSASDRGGEADAGHAGKPQGDGDERHDVQTRGPGGDDGQARRSHRWDGGRGRGAGRGW